MSGYRKEEINTSPEYGWNREIFATIYRLFYFTSPLLSIKATKHQTRQEGSLTLVHHLLSLLAFQIKLLFLALTNSSLNLLACCAGSNTNLDSTRTSWHHFWSCKFPIWIWSVINPQVSFLCYKPSINRCLHFIATYFCIATFQLQQCLETKNVDKLDLKSDSQISVLCKK